MRPFEELTEAVESKGWRVEVTTMADDIPVVCVITDDPEFHGNSYSRRVENGESYDSCAQIVLDALRRSKVL